jgi:MFS family permease
MKKVLAENILNVESAEINANDVTTAHHSVRKAWGITLLLSCLQMINFADKAIIGLAAVPIMKDMHLSHEQFGTVGSVFFLFYSAAAIAVGFMANRFSTKVLLGVLAALWAMLQLPMIGTVTLTTLLICRCILGAGEGPAYPLCLHAMYKWFKNDVRPFPAAVIASGAYIGSGLGAPLLTWIIVQYNWHAAFGFLGVVGLVWLVIWLIFGEEGPESTERKTGTFVDPRERVPYTKLIFSRTTLGVMVGTFCCFWSLTLSIVWLPVFLIKGVGYSAKDVGWIVMLPFLMQAFCGPALAFLSQRMLAWGVSSRIARGLMGGTAVIVSGASMIGLACANGGVVEILLVIGSFSFGNLMFNLGAASIGEVSPPSQRGALLGINHGVYSVAGLFAPWVMGHVVDIASTVQEGFRSGFLSAGILILIGGIVACVLVNPERDAARLRKAQLL